MGISVRRLNGALGARIDGIGFGDGKIDLSGEELETISAALYQHSVVAIAAKDMSPMQHLALARHFGEPEHHEFFPNLGPELEEITLLDSTRDRSNMWHTDEPFLTTPPIITMTHAQQLPSYGGDTLFTSLHAAYDDLSPGMKDYIAPLEAVHDYAMISEHSWRRGTADAPATLAQRLSEGKRATHRLVLRHPANNRPAAWVNETYTRMILGVPPLEAQTLLQFLFRHMQKPEYQYRHRWCDGDLLIWDNRSVLHYAAFDYADRRIMHRVSVLGRIS